MKKARNLLNVRIGAEWGATPDGNGEMGGADEEEKREQTVRQTDRWFNGGLIKDVNEQCLTTNERWEAVLTDR